MLFGTRPAHQRADSEGELRRFALSAVGALDRTVKPDPNDAQKKIRWKDRRAEHARLDRRPVQALVKPPSAEFTCL
jgi:hypothetical protein